MKLTWRIWLLIAFLIIAFLAISPTTNRELVIKSIDRNSSAIDQGMKTGEVLISLNNQEVKTQGDYARVFATIIEENQSKLTIKTDRGEYVFFDEKFPEISVGPRPASNIKTGLDLSGGARALVKPANVTLSASEMEMLVSIMSQRLNAFGLSDVVVRPVTDLSGNSFLLIEIAGAAPGDIRELVGQQGRFEAKIANKTVFEGGEKDIADVCRNDAQCAGITQCSQDSSGAYFCNFRFTVYLTEDAAQKHAKATDALDIDQTGRYLSEKIFLYVDDIEVDSLFIGLDLKGSVTTQISIQGAGSGATQEIAYNDALANMHKLQTILLTGSLPYKLEIVKLDTISPVLGKEFLKGIILLGLLVFLFVSISIFIKYRKWKVSLAVILTMFSEAFITLGLAAFIRWNLDASAIAGIIAGMGTGVNDQIVILDESLSKEAQEDSSSLKERIKRALFIIIGAFLTIVAAMLPLFWAGAGLLKGFALTTILGVSVGILITRPAFADIIRKIEE